MSDLAPVREMRQVASAMRGVGDTLAELVEALRPIAARCQEARRLRGGES